MLFWFRVNRNSVMPRVTFMCLTGLRLHYAIDYQRSKLRTLGLVRFQPLKRPCGLLHLLEWLLIA